MKNAIKNFNLKILVCTLLMYSFFSCSSVRYQISTLKSNSVDETFEYNNNDINLEYNFWGKGGVLNFKIKNNTDKPIFIDWERSNFIFNGYSYDYFSNDQTMQTLGIYKSSSLSGLVDLDYNPNTITPGLTSSSVTKMASSSTITQDKKNIQIPPNSYINAKTIDLDFPWNKNKNSNITLDKKNTPLNIRTYIAYSKNKSLDSLLYVDNEFWIENIQEYKGKDKSKNEANNKFYTSGKRFDPIITGVMGGFLTLFVVLISTAN